MAGRPIGPIQREGLGGVRAGRTSITVKKTASGIKKTGSVSRKAKPESFSYRGKDLTKAERKEISKQNKAAESMKSKNLDRVESGRRGARTRKERQMEREEYAYSFGKQKGRRTGRIEGAAGTAILGGATISLAEKIKREKKSKKKK